MFFIFFSLALCLRVSSSALASENKQYAALRDAAMEEAIGIEYAASEEPAVRADIREYRARLREEAMEETLQKAPSMVRFSAAASTEHRTTFYIDYILPLYYSEDQTTLLFFNPKQVWHSPRAEETNLGVGLRKLFAEKYILGLHFFRDKKLSRHNFWHRQFGVGAEYLSDPLDLRVNYYHPTTKAKMVDYGYEFTETSLARWETVEEPLEGYDMEAGTPVFGDKLNTRIFAGGFFYNSRLGKDRNGFRARTETNLAKWLSIDTIYNLRTSGEGEFIGGIRINLPLELTKKNPLKVPARQTPLRERMFERVVRDIDIQTQEVDWDEFARNARGETINMIYVDNTNTSGIEDGSLSHPYSSLAAAFGSSRYGAGAYVYVAEGDGTNTGYTSSSGYTLADEVVLWGSGYNGGYKGLPATAGYPKLDGDNSAVNPVITLADNNTVMGLDIQHGYNGIYGENINGADIHHNTIANNLENGVYLLFNDGESHSGFTCAGNTITGNVMQTYYGGNGILVQNNAGSLADFTFTDNNISGNDVAGVRIDGNGLFSDFTFSGNTCAGNEKQLVGIYIVTVDGGAVSNFTVADNILTGNVWCGMRIVDDFATISRLTLTGNVISGNGSDGVNLSNHAGTMSGFTFTGNTTNENGIGGYGGRGITLDNSDGIVSDFIFTDNTSSGNGSDGIYLGNHAGTMSGFTFTGNTINENGGGYIGNGIALCNDSRGSVSDFAFIGNTISGNSGSFTQNNGIILATDRGQLSNFSFTGNTITGNNGGDFCSGNGIVTFAHDGELSDFSFTGNTITGNSGGGSYSGNGIAVLLNPDSAFSGFTYSGNTVTSNSGENYLCDNNVVYLNPWWLPM